MTSDKHAKRAARNLAVREGISYTAARRRLDEQQPDHEWRVLPAVACATRCDSSPHPGYACRAWRPQDAKHADFYLRRAAELPSGRARHIAETTGCATGHRSEDTVLLLALVYAWLADSKPQLLRPAELRAAVEAGDQAAVDAALEPLDRAAARWLSKHPEHWWKHLKPRISAYLASLDDREFPHDMIEADWLGEVGRLARRWDRAWVEYTNYNGYPDQDGVSWMGAKEAIDLHLTARHGGHNPGTDVRLHDGRPVRVVEAEWDLSGPPVAYWAVALVPRALDGRLISSLSTDIQVRPGDIDGKLPAPADRLPFS
ncbi:hypothetical protein [Streptomyces sp. NPDC092903]|uniref:hypothetical protein n=1 Tax=Streptomyces sp. NPDC092903 TaxID=3366017 RepID=UPI0037F2D179